MKIESAAGVRWRLIDGIVAAGLPRSPDNSREAVAQAAAT